MRKPYQSPGQDEKLILLYCPGRGLNSRPPVHCSFKHGQHMTHPALATFDTLTKATKLMYIDSRIAAGMLLTVTKIMIVLSNAAIVAGLNPTKFSVRCL